MNGPNGDFNGRLRDLKAARGDRIAIDEVAEVVASIMSTMQGDFSAVDLRVYKELGRSRHVHQQREERDCRHSPGQNPRRAPSRRGRRTRRHRHPHRGSDQRHPGRGRGDRDRSQPASGPGPDRPGRPHLRGLQLPGHHRPAHRQDRRPPSSTSRRESKRSPPCSAISFSSSTPPMSKSHPRPSTPIRPCLHGPQLPQEANNQDDIDALLASFD